MGKQGFFSSGEKPGRQWGCLVWNGGTVLMLGPPSANANTQTPLNSGTDSHAGLHSPKVYWNVSASGTLLVSQQQHQVRGPWRQAGFWEQSLIRGTLPTLEPLSPFLLLLAGAKMGQVSWEVCAWLRSELSFLLLSKEGTGKTPLASLHLQHRVPFTYSLGENAGGTL